MRNHAILTRRGWRELLESIEGLGLAKSSSTYAKAVKAQLVHAHVASNLSEEKRKMEILRKRKRIELGLVAAISNMNKHASIHNIRATPGEVLSPRLEQSCIGFLVSTNVVEAKIDASKIKRETDYLRKCVIIAYFVGGLQTTRILENWMVALSKEVKTEIKIYKLLE